MVVLLVCGGGNGAHAMAGIGSSHANTQVRVLTLYADEAQRWTNIMEGNEFITDIHNSDKSITRLHTKPKLVTKDPAEAVPGADIIILTVPAFAHVQYLETLKPLVSPGAILVGLPGQPGFEFDVYTIWGELASKCTILNFESLPWACRIEEFGKCVHVLGAKEDLVGALHPGSVSPHADPLPLLQGCLGPHPTLIIRGHLLGISLTSVNCYIHSSILYGKWHDWDGKAVDKLPLFYQGIDQKAADIMSGMSDEIIAVAKGIMQTYPEVDLHNITHILQYYLRVFANEITDKTSLFAAITSNAVYDGLVHPMVKTEDGKYAPDFKHRYLGEDIPYGLVVCKGVAELSGVPTPLIDMILQWCQEKMGKEYLVDGKMKGKDISTTRCPQRYGLNTMESMLKMLK